MLRCLGRCAPRHDPGRGRTRRVGGAAPREAEAHLLRIRARAARDTPGLSDAEDAVRSAVRAVGVIARRPEERVSNRTALLAAARAYALEARRLPRRSVAHSRARPEGPRVRPALRASARLTVRLRPRCSGYQRSGVGGVSPGSARADPGRARSGLTIAALDKLGGSAAWNKARPAPGRTPARR